MRKAEVELHAIYEVKVNNKLTMVRLDRESPYGGWEGTNLATGRKVRVRSAAKLRRLVQAARMTTLPATKNFSGMPD